MKSAMRKLVTESRVLVCVGSGGVGKTTVSALIGMEAALQGRRVLVLTIDPARRLANSLGVEGLDHTPQRIDLSAFPSTGDGELWATMLDMKQAFDAIVEKEITNAADREALLSNRFYTYFSTSLAGAQELSASDRLIEVVRTGDWDLVVLDTPPTSNALDFLEAPHRYFEALDGAVMQWVSQVGASISRTGSPAGVANQLLLKGLGKITGTELFVELATFFKHFSPLFEGFRERTRATADLFSEAGTRFVIVTAPDPDTVEEALYFREKLAKYAVHLGGVVVNRMRPAMEGNPLLEQGPGALAEALREVEGAALIGATLLDRLARRLASNARDFDALAERDREVSDALQERVGRDIPLVRVPLLSTDVHTLAGLNVVLGHLFGPPETD